MIINLDELTCLLKRKFKEGHEFNVWLLEQIIDNRTRFYSAFRLSNIKTKIIQYIMQSREIKFGDVIEELVQKYIEKIGYTNIDKHLKNNKNSSDLYLDLHFCDKNSLFMVEMKIRDDHDSSKKRGQINNFKVKIEYLLDKYKTQNIKAIFWFVDHLLTRNKKFYQNELNKLSYDNVQIHLCYGKEFFDLLENSKNIWDELILLIKEYKNWNENQYLNIPDFANSIEIYNALLDLSEKYWLKLISNKDEYIEIRKSLFENGQNLEKVKAIRNKKQI